MITVQFEGETFAQVRQSILDFAKGMGAADRLPVVSLPGLSTEKIAEPAPATPFEQALEKLPPPPPAQPVVETRPAPPPDVETLRTKLRGVLTPLMATAKKDAVTALIKQFGGSVTTIPIDKLPDVIVAAEILAKEST